MKKKFSAPICIIREIKNVNIMTVSQQVALDWNSSWGEGWDPYQ